MSADEQHKNDLGETVSRIDALEMTVAEQQVVIDDLNEMITKQWKTLDLMKLELSNMTDQVQNLEESQSAPAHQKAPHY